MTTNQVAYWSLLEQNRSNEAREAETHRSNIAMETENVRHNKASEYNQWISAQAAASSAAAAHRNAAANERNAETNAYNATINARHAAVAERNAAVNERNAAVGERNAATNELNATTAAGRLAFDQLQYEDTGRDRVLAETADKKASAAEKAARTGSTEVSTTAAVFQLFKDAGQYVKDNAGIYGGEQIFRIISKIGE